MKLRIISFKTVILLLTVNTSIFGQLAYQNPQIPIEKRVENLLQQMTLEEKIVELSFDAPANTRLGIPLMQHGECLHGLEMDGATIFPQAIALGCTWNTKLVNEISSGIAREARSVGITHCYSPVLDVARDPRYGRVEECYGEDPYLISRIGVAFVQGLQGMDENRFDENHILATAKHFAGYSEPQQGLNGAYVDISKRTMHEIFFPPYEAVVKEAKIGSVMPGHQDLNGIPCHMNAWLLQDMLRDEWGFDGFVVSDNNDLFRLFAMHKVAVDKEAAAYLGLKAGVDMDLVLNKSIANISYNEQVLTKAMELYPDVEKLIDISVGRILKAKFELGLFDNPPQNTNKPTVISLEENQELSLQAAKESIVLLKNENGLLPLNQEKIKSIAILGPNAHGDDKEEIRLLQGGYSSNPPFYVSLYDGLKKYVGDDIEVNYTQGCSLYNESKDGFKAALTLSKKADVVIMCLGENRKTCGEGADRDNISLLGGQLELLKEVNKLGKPVVLVLMNGRQLDLTWPAEHVPAILESWYPGMMGGEAISEILFGKTNPSGKLTVSFPRNIGQLPVTYLQKPDFLGMGGGQYLNQPDKTPLYHFGFGLSYTKFEYSDLKLDKTVISKEEETTVRLKVTNTGKVAGDEIVQLYVKDDYASVGRYKMRLKGFQRISLNPAETKELSFNIGFDELFLLDKDLKEVVEPGDFTIYIGSSSRQEDLSALKLEVVEN